VTPKDLARESKAYFANHYLGYDLAYFQYEILEDVIPNNRNRLITVSRNTGKTEVILATHVMHESLFKFNNPILLLSRSNDLVKKIVNFIEIQLTENERIVHDFEYELNDFKRTDNNLRFNQQDKNKSELRKSKEYQIEGKSIESSLTGNHYNEIVFDDLEDNKSVLTPYSRAKTKDYINNTVTPLLNPGCPKTAFGTFKHLDDIYNYWIKSKTWYHYSAPVAYKMPKSWDYVYDENGIAIDVKNIKGDYKLLFPKRWNIKNILLLIPEIGRTAFEREYQNNINAMKGTTLKLEWIKHCAITKKASEEYGVELIPPLENLEIYQGVDLAIGEKEQNDYFVCETIGVQRIPQFKIFVLDWYRDKLGFPDQFKTLQLLYNSSLNPIWRGKIWNVLTTTIESNSYQLAMSQNLIYSTNMNIIPFTSVGSKEAGIIANSVKFQNGQIYLPIDHPNYPDFENEYSNFPKGAHDDMLDANKFATTSIINVPVSMGMQTARY